MTQYSGLKTLFLTAKINKRKFEVITQAYMKAIETTPQFDEDGKFKLNTDQENEDWFGFSPDLLSRFTSSMSQNTHFH